MNPTISVENLTKIYALPNKKLIALDNISFTIEKGDFIAVVGPDGAGKTTLIKILCGLLNFDKGNIKILNYKLPEQHNKIKNSIGYLSQHFSLYANLTVEENLKYFCRLFSIQDYKKRIDSLMEIANLSFFRKRLARELSGGMKQKLSIICCLVHSPEILFLDEPTTGIDPISRRELFKIIEEKIDEGTTVFMSTAYMDEAERAKKIIFLNEGKIIQFGSYAEILEKSNCKVFSIITENPSIADSLKEIEGIKFINPIGNRLQILVDKEVPEEMIASKIRGTDAQIFSERVNMEMLFINSLLLQSQTSSSSINSNHFLDFRLRSRNLLT